MKGPIQQGGGGNKKPAKNAKAANELPEEGSMARMMAAIYARTKDRNIPEDERTKIPSLGDLTYLLGNPSDGKTVFERRQIEIANRLYEKSRELSYTILNTENDGERLTAALKLGLIYEYLSHADRLGDRFISFGQEVNEFLEKERVTEDELAIMLKKLDDNAHEVILEKDPDLVRRAEEWKKKLGL